MVDIPKWYDFMRPLLEVLKENGEMHRHDAVEAVVLKVGLTPEQLAEVQISDGKSKAKDMGLSTGDEVRVKLVSVLPYNGSITFSL